MTIIAEVPFMNISKPLKYISIIATLTMIFVQIGGALVSKTGSADGCGSSWPLCHGQVIPKTFPMDTIIELAHRGVSGFALIIVVALGYLALKEIGHIRETKFLVSMSIGFLVLQALIGAAAVVWQQNDFVLALHFGISLISFASVFLLSLLIFEVDQKFEAREVIIQSHLKWHTILFTMSIYIAIYSGALVRHTESTLACISWPHCNSDSIFMPSNFYEYVHMGHRTLAFIMFLWFTYITYHAVKHYHEYRVVKNGYALAYLFIVMQVVTGAITIFTLGNIFIMLLHALFITLLFGMLCYFIMLISRSK